MSDQTNLGCTNAIINAWFSADCVLPRFNQTLLVLQRLLKENRKEKGGKSLNPTNQIALVAM